MKEKVAILAALVVAGVSVLAMRRYVENQRAQFDSDGERVSYVTAARHLAKGTVLAPEDLSIAHFPRDARPSSAVEAANQSLLAGRPLIRDRLAGEPILWLDVPDTGRELADLVPVTQRAFSLPLNETNSLGGMLRPRDRVDVFCVLPEAGSADEGPRRVARLLVPNAAVLAVGGNTPVSESLEETPSTVTLSLKPLEVQLLALAMQEGDLVLALRNPADAADADGNGLPDVRSEHLYRPDRLEELARAQRERIEIYKEGVIQPR